MPKKRRTTRRRFKRKPYRKAKISRGLSMGSHSHYKTIIRGMSILPIPPTGGLTKGAYGGFMMNFPGVARNSDGSIGSYTVANLWTNLLNIFDEYQVLGMELTWNPGSAIQGNTKANDAIYLQGSEAYVTDDLDDFTLITTVQSMMTSCTKPLNIFRKFRKVFRNRTQKKGTWFNCSVPYNATTNSQGTILPPNAYGGVKFLLPDITNVSNTSYAQTFDQYGTFNINFVVAFRGVNTSLQVSAVSQDTLLVQEGITGTSFGHPFDNWITGTLGIPSYVK